MFRAASAKVGTADGTCPHGRLIRSRWSRDHLNGSGGDPSPGTGPGGALGHGLAPANGWGCHTGRDPSGAVEPSVRGGPGRGLYKGVGVAVCAQSARCLRGLTGRKLLRERE